MAILPPAAPPHADRWHEISLSALARGRQICESALRSAHCWSTHSTLPWALTQDWCRLKLHDCTSRRLRWLHKHVSVHCKTIDVFSAMLRASPRILPSQRSSTRSSGAETRLCEQRVPAAHVSSPPSAKRTGSASVIVITAAGVSPKDSAVAD